MKKELKNKVFKQWIIVRNEFIENKNQALTDIIEKHDLSVHLSKILVELELLKSFNIQNGYKKTVSSWKIINDITDEMKFNIHYAKIKKVRLIYVFDNENKLIFADKNIAELTRKYQVSYKQILRSIENKAIINNYYFSENADFVIPVIDNVNIPEKKINKVEKKVSKKVLIGSLEDKWEEKDRAKRVLDFAKSLNKPVRFISKKEAFQNSLKRDFNK